MKTSWMYVVALLVWSLSPSSVQAEVKRYVANGSEVIEVKIDGVDFHKASVDGFNKVKINGAAGFEGVDFKLGHPEIPTIRFYVNEGAKVEVMNPSFGPLAISKVPAKVLPNQESVEKLPHAKAKAFRLDQKVYGSTEFLPGKLFDIKEAGKVRGVKRQLVTLYPFQYNPASSEYKVIKNFKITSRVRNLDVAGSELIAFVVGEQFANSPSLNAYMQLKQDMGFDVETIQISSANDNPNAIRSALQDLYASSEGALKYAIIIGDQEDVPGYNTSAITGVTDHYYRAIDTENYDDDINGPDLGVGRISVTDEAMLAGVLEKYARYQRGTFSDQSWLNGAAFLATNDRYTVAEGSHNYAIDTHTANRNYRGIFPEADQPGGDKVYSITHRATYEDTQRVVRAGRTIINYSGHGGYTLWDSPRMTQEDVRALDDPNAIPFVISNACITGDFRKPESFGETWQRHPNGAIMFWGSMDSSYWDEDDIMERRMYDGIYAENLLRFASITQKALGEVWKYYGGQGKSRYYWETYVTFGDPSISLRTHEVVQANIEAASPILVGADQAVYKLTNRDNAPIVGARAALVSETGKTIQVAYSNESGEVVFTDISASIQDPQAIELVVSGQNLPIQVYSDNVLAPDSAFLQTKDVLFNGGTEAHAISLEDVSLSFAIANVGGAASEAATVELLRLAGPVHVTSQPFTIDGLDSQDSILSENQLSFQIAADALVDEIASLQILITAENGETFQKTVHVKIKGASIGSASTDFGGDWENGEGGINVGESGDVYFTLTNSGNLDILDAQLSGTGVTCIDSVSNRLTIQRMEAGQTFRISQPLQVTISSQCQAGDLAELKLVGTYANEFGRVPLTATVSFPVGKLSTMSSINEDLEVQIIDKDTTTFEFQVSKAGILADLGLDLSLTHTYMYDISISLVHPDGTKVLVLPRTRTGDDNLERTFGMNGQAIEGINTLKDKSIAGTWKLEIVDHSTRDEGTLFKANLHLKGYIN